MDEKMTKETKLGILAYLAICIAWFIFCWLVS